MANTYDKYSHKDTDNPRALEDLKLGDTVYCTDYMEDTLKYLFIALSDDFVIVSSNIFCKAEELINLLKGIENDSFSTHAIHVFHRDNVCLSYNKYRTLRKDT